MADETVNSIANDQVESVEDSRRPFHPRASLWALAGFAVLLFFQGFFYQTLDPDVAEGRSVLFGLGNQFLLFSWCFFDARERGVYILHSFQWLILGFALVAAPIYYIWSRGWRWSPLLLCYAAIVYALDYMGALSGWIVSLYL